MIDLGYLVPVPIKKKVKPKKYAVKRRHVMKSQTSHKILTSRSCGNRNI